MPDYRLTPKRESYSDKLTSLDHLAYRVWQQYKASADDYGVMPDSAALIRGDNRRLEKEPEKTIRACLDQMIQIELVHRFLDQGQSYLYSRVWQTHQKVRYPSETFYPAPPPEELLRCDKKTRVLFEQRFAKTSEIDLQDLEISSAPPVCAQARNANANANASTDPEALGREPEREPPLPAPLIDQSSHRKHAFCGHVCVPSFMHERFVRQSGGDEADTNADIRRWYAEVNDAWARRAVGDKPEDFWAARFKERTGTTVAVSGPRRPAALPVAADWRRRCAEDRQHLPVCATPTACDLKFDREQRGAA